MGMSAGSMGMGGGGMDMELLNMLLKQAGDRNEDRARRMPGGLPNNVGNGIMGLGPSPHGEGGLPPVQRLELFGSMRRHELQHGDAGVGPGSSHATAGAHRGYGGGDVLSPASGAIAGSALRGGAGGGCFKELEGFGGATNSPAASSEENGMPPKKRKVIPL